MSFDELGLKPEILRAIADAGYTEPTPIQAQAIPFVLQSRDLLGIAQTGTGKTASFTLPMIQNLATGRAKARMPRSLILEPTRELATQVAANFETYGKYERLNCALIIGGENMDEQIRKLDRGVDVLIATPGRLIDLFERGRILLADVKILVIDEADRMLDMGFIPDIERIVTLLSPARQTLLFSATMPKEIRRLADKFLNDPKEVQVTRPASTADLVSQYLVTVDRADKRAALRALLTREPVRNALVFCNRKRDIGVVYRSLQRHGFNAGQLHGDMSQPARTETLAKFKAGEILILVCSDVAARGLDITELSHVFNFDVPTHSDDYVHRIGRTGRAGRSGRAYTIATDAESKYVASIEALTRKPLERLSLDDLTRSADDDERPSAPAREESRRRRGPGRKAEQPAAETTEDVAEQPAAARPAAPSGERRSAGSGRPPRRESTGRGDGRRERSGRNERGSDRAGDRGSDRGGDRGDRGRRDWDRDVANPGNDRVVGLGDHVPAFLLRSVRTPDSDAA